MVTSDQLTSLSRINFLSFDYGDGKIGRQGKSFCADIFQSVQIFDSVGTPTDVVLKKTKWRSPVDNRPSTDYLQTTNGGFKGW